VTLKISVDLLDRIRAHGRSTYPEECCGLLLGEADGAAKSVRDLRAMRNTREDSPKNRYLIDPRELLDAEREARARKLDIVGVYHSHPDHPARPSEFDREHAFPWYSYIVVRVASGEPGELTSWVLLDDRSAFDAEEIEIL
jgi:proteasome lid subunit RPN8/RPN11